MAVVEVEEEGYEEGKGNEGAKRSNECGGKTWW